MGCALTRRFGCILAGMLLSGLLVAPVAGQKVQSPAGHWAGTVDVGGRPLAFQIDFIKADTGWTGTISVPEQNATDIPLIDIAVRGDSMVFGISLGMGQPTFRGTWRDEGRTLAGAFSQGPTNTTFTMSRAEAAKAAPAGEPAAAEKKH